MFDSDVLQCNITGLEAALLVNFKAAKLTWKRVVAGELEEKSQSSRFLLRWPVSLDPGTNLIVGLAAAAWRECGIVTSGTTDSVESVFPLDNKPASL